jgi:hypothetical protein
MRRPTACCHLAKQVRLNWKPSGSLGDDASAYLAARRTTQFIAWSCKISARRQMAAFWNHLAPRLVLATFKCKVY